MIHKIRLITFIDLVFIFMLGISGSMKNDALSNTVYYLAFIIPIALGISYIFAFSKASGENTKDVLRELLGNFGIKKSDALLALPIIAVGIGAVLLISIVTTSVMGLFGKENTVSFNEPFIVALLIHALLPAVLEELLFRFIPINLLRDEPKAAILMSGMFFSFAHANVFQIPYAFAAGVIFATLYVITGSILPCMVMHLCNNVLSITSIYGYDSTALWIAFASVLVASLAFITVRRKSYSTALEKLHSDSKSKLGYSPILFVAISLTFAISALLV